MAMMIAKFHKLIQSRLLWFLFLVVIVFSFVIWGMQGPADNELAAEVRSAGTLHNENISYEDFRAARSSTYLALAIMMGQAPRLNEEQEKELTASAWRRLASLRLAREMKFSAGDDEVREAIKAQPIFADESKRFNPRAYQQFVYVFLRSVGMSEAHFEQYVREELMLQKLRMMVAQGLLVAPYEIQRTYDAVSDSFDIEYVLITPSDVENKLDITDAKVADYFAENRDDFMIPPKVAVRYVKFPVADFMDAAEVTEEDALAYYTDNAEEFTKIVTKEEKLSDEEKAADPVDTLTASLDEEDETVTTPFEEVRDSILDDLRVTAARNLAADKATDLVVALSPDREDRGISFEEGASQFGLTIAETEPFSIRETIKGIDAGLDFNAAAFDLQPGRDDYFSNAVLGKDYVYVLAYLTNLPERLPELAEVEEDVRLACETDAAIKAMSDLADSFKKEAEAAAGKGEKTFSQIARQYDLQVQTVTNLNIMAADEDAPHLGDILPKVLIHNRTEITDPIVAEDGLLVVHITDRRASGITSIATLRPQIVEALKRERRPALFRDWEDFLLQRGNFEDKVAAAADEEEEEEAENDEEI